MGIPEKIKAVQDEIGRTQLNKATEHHIGILKAKIAKLKREQEAVQIKKVLKNLMDLMLKEVVMQRLLLLDFLVLENQHCSMP